MDNSNQQSLKPFFDFIGFISAPGEIIEPTYETLVQITTLQTRTVAYQNQNIFRTRELMDMSAQSIWERIVEQKLGGMCFEISELTYYVLTSLGYNVQRIPSDVLGEQEYNPNNPKTHAILLVKIGQDKYLVDVGFGYNSFREPLRFSFEKTENQSTSLNEKYQLHCESTYYLLKMEIKGKMTNFYGFDRDLSTGQPVVISQEQTIENYRKLVRSPTETLIRDLKLYSGKVTATGRIGYVFTPNESSQIRLDIQADGETKKTVFQTLRDFIEDVQAVTGIALDDTILRRPQLSYEQENQML